MATLNRLRRLILDPRAPSIINITHHLHTTAVLTLPDRRRYLSPWKDRGRGLARAANTTQGWKLAQVLFPMKAQTQG